MVLKSFFPPPQYHTFDETISYKGKGASWVPYFPIDCHAFLFLSWCIPDMFCIKSFFMTLDKIAQLFLLFVYFSIIQQKSDWEKCVTCLTLDILVEETRAIATHPANICGTAYVWYIVSRMKSFCLAAAYARDASICGTDFQSGILYKCDCHYGLSNVNPQNMVWYCLELLQWESISHVQSLLPQSVLLTAVLWLLWHMLTISSF